MTGWQWHYLWLPLVAWLLWCGLRYRWSSRLRAVLVAGSWPLRVQFGLRETVLFGLCLAVAFGGSWELSPAPAFLPPLLLTLMLLPVAAWAEGEDGSRHRWLRPVLVGLAIVGHWARLRDTAIALHDAVIAGWLVDTGWNLSWLLSTIVFVWSVLVCLLLASRGGVRRGLGVLLGFLLAASVLRLLQAPEFLFAALCFLIAAVLVVDFWGWRWSVRSLVRKVLAAWFRFDPRGGSYTKVRHLVHGLTSPASPLHRQVRALRLIVAVFTGATPSRQRALRDAALDHDGEYFLGQRDKAAEQARRSYRSWRAALLFGLETADLPRVCNDLTDWGRWEWVWQNWRDCPHAPCTGRTKHSALWNRMPTLTRALVAWHATAPVAARDEAVWNDLRQRLTRDLDTLARSDASLLWLKTLADTWLQHDCTDGDLRRLSTRESLLRWSGASVGRAEPGVVLILDDYRRADDWAGMLEAARQIMLRTGYPLTSHDHLELGEACWRHADELGAGLLLRWTCENAVGHFILGHCAEHLGSGPFEPSQRRGDT